MNNKKGYMLIELILASLIAFALAMYMVSLTIKLKNKNDDLLVESLVTTDSAVATNALLKIINEHPNDFDCGLISVDKDKNMIKYNNQIIASFSDYAILKESLSYCKDDGLDGSAQVFIGVDVPQIPNKDFNIVIDYIKRKEPSARVLFEGVGNYGYAIAGSNNASKGDTSENAWSTNKWVVAPPDDTAKYQAILNQLKTKEGINSLTNISGSYLDTGGGVVTKAIFGYFAYGSGGTGTKYDGKILLIRPDYTYTFIPYEQKGWGWAEYLDITDYIDKHNPTGWYYVSFVGASRAPQLAWSMTTIYEGGGAPYSYTELVLDESVLARGGDKDTLDVMFETHYKLKGTYQLTGTILAGGIAAHAVSWDTTGDQVFALLNEGQPKQLYQMNYKGKTIFEGRSSQDFACDVFNTVKNHNIAGGELDIFNETLDSDFFGGRELTGIRIYKHGNNGLKAGLIGVSMAIENELKD